VASGLQHCSEVLDTLVSCASMPQCAQACAGSLHAAAQRLPASEQIAQLHWSLSRAQSLLASSHAAATAPELALCCVVCGARATSASEQVPRAALLEEAAAHVQQRCMTLFRVTQACALQRAAASAPLGDPAGMDALVNSFVLVASQVPGRATREAWLCLAVHTCAVQHMGGVQAWQRCALVAAALAPHTVTDARAKLEALARSSAGSSVLADAGPLLVRLRACIAKWSSASRSVASSVV
jgi:hypothetical protein